MSTTPRKRRARGASSARTIEVRDDAVEIVDETPELDAPQALDAGPDWDQATVAPDQSIVPRTTEQLAPVDLLQRYMAEVARHPLMTREEEQAVAREYVETGDPQLAYRLVTANLRLVVKLAWEYRRAAFNMLDLIQEGNVGLMQAVKKFDPDRGVKLSTYSAWWIRAYIIRYVMDNWRMVKLGTTQAQRKIFFNLRKEKDKLSAQGFDPEPKLLAERLDVTEKEVIEMDQRLDGADMSLDAPLSDDGGGGSFVDHLADGGMALDDAFAERQVLALFKERLAEFGEGLEGKELEIFERRLVAEEPETLQSLGKSFGVTRERARQIEARLVKRLKAWMKENLPDFDELSVEPPDQ